jgi:hypothetical protein
MKLPGRLLEIHRALDRAGVEHAFGGAIALAYWTLDPRGTSDIDVNVFVSPAECRDVLRALPDGIDQPAGTEELIRRDGQIRLRWDETPVDLFFDYAPVHEEAARDRQTVPFVDTEIPVLGPVELAVFKAMFNRTKDWGDIEAMVERGTLDLDAVRGWLREMMGEADERLARLDEAERRASAAAAR